jgi:hypothetical protein
MDTPYLSPECAVDSNDIGQLGRVVMDGVALHQLVAREQFEVLECRIVFLLVLERDDVTTWYGAVSLLPGQDVDPDPVSRRVSGV